MQWKSLDKDRKYRINSDGLTIIKPKKKIMILPAECPVCDVMFNSTLDLESYNNSKCCSNCEVNYAYLDRDTWLSGARPPKDVVEKDLQNRKISIADLKF